LDVVGNSVWFSTNKGRIFHSTDKGATWAVYTSPILDFAGANISANFSFASASIGYIVTNGGAVYKTTNAGSTWIQLATTGPIFSNGLCAIVNTNTIFTTGAATGGSGSSYSLDGGLTWSLIDNQQHLYCEFLTPSIGWSGWFNTNATTNGMWKWNNLSSPLAVQFNGNPSTVCVNTPVQFTDQTTGGVINSWNWSFPGGSPSTASIANPVVTYAQPGTYAVSLTVSDGTNLSSFQDTAYITVETMPATPGAIQGNAAPCPNAVETYSVANDPSAYYSWTFPATWLGMSTTNSISLTLDNTPGILSVTAGNSCGSSPAATLNINLGAQPTAGFTYTLNGGQLTLTNTSQNANGFDWNFGDGTISTQTQPTHLFTTPGTYLVTLIATNACGQSDTLIQELTVLGLEDLSALGITAYPNPTSGLVTLSGLANYISEELSIIDLQGRIVERVKIESDVQVIAFTHAVNGLYLIRIQNGVLPLRLQR
jgi:PKD repeat protein